MRIRLGPGPQPVDVLRRLDGAPGLVCLLGAWADGGALIAWQPTRTARSAAVLSGGTGAVREEVGGGWFGWLAFSGASWLGWYDEVLRYRDGEWWFEALAGAAAQRERDLAGRCAELSALLSAARRYERPDERPDERSVATGRSDPTPDEARHLAAVEAAVGAIRAGEIYQVNVCTRFGATLTGSGVELFARLAALQPDYGAYLAADGREIVSASPELFLRRRGRNVVTRPIKGTLPRDVTGNDLALRRSAKDAAENVMIVDLMRNDLGRVCETGTVRAESLLDVEAHPGVWHLVSTVTGRLRAGVRDADLLAATFPPGSVTGAPKVRALAEIAALEAVPRGVHTGAIGFASPAWGTQFSVAIRTFEAADGRIELGVGGGITADSVPVQEWRECLHKAAPLFGAAGLPLPTTEVAVAEPWQYCGGLLETVLVRHGEPVRLADHLARLDRSCRELYGRPAPDLAALARDTAATATGERAVLRLVLCADGTVETSCRVLGPPPTACEARVVHGRGGLWRHKWADRARLAADEAAGTPLYVASDATVLETSRGNVFLIGDDGALVTPPLRDDLLPGVTRRALLDLARDRHAPVSIRPFGLAEMMASPAFWTSSLSGAVPIHAVDGVGLPRADSLIDELARALFVR